MDDTVYTRFGTPARIIARTADEYHYGMAVVVRLVDDDDIVVVNTDELRHPDGAAGVARATIAAPRTAN